MALYFASDRAVPTTEWRQGESVFCIQALDDGEARVQQQFSKPGIRYLGAHTGCSCGFSYGQNPPISPEDEQEERAARQSVDALRAFLAEQVASCGEVELFACWEGDQDSPPEQRLEVAPEHFGGESFALPEKVFYVVRGRRRTSA